MIPRVRLLASFSCLCSEGFIFPTSGSHTITSSFVEAIGDGSKKFAPDSYTLNKKRVKTMYNIWTIIIKLNLTAFHVHVTRNIILICLRYHRKILKGKEKKQQ